MIWTGPCCESVAGDLLKVCKTKKTELLFLTLFLRILKIGGRCACIVPDGVIFASSTAHKVIRKEIVENQRLEAVISMPSGVFKPYAGVSTAILIFTKTEHGGTDQVWFYDMRQMDIAWMTNEPKSPLWYRNRKSWIMGMISVSINTKKWNMFRWNTRQPWKS